MRHSLTAASIVLLLALFGTPSAQEAPPHLNPMIEKPQVPIVESAAQGVCYLKSDRSMHSPMCA